MKCLLWHFAHGTTAVLFVACAKFCSEMMAFNGVTPKPIWHRIWVTMEKSFVKWAPDRHCSQRRPSCLARSKVAHWISRPGHGWQGRRKVLNVFRTGCSKVAQIRLARALPWLQNGCKMVGQWSPCNKCVLLQSWSFNLGDAYAFLVTNFVPPLAHK